jgi:isopenicillin-N epimerase
MLDPVKIQRPDNSDSVWAAARAAMILDPAVINLNTGSFGPLPKPVFDRVTELRRQLAAEPTDFFVRRVPPLLWEARERFACLLGGESKRFVFAANVSAAINIIASGLTIPAPGEILLTDHEYGAMHWCWERAAIRQGLSLRTFPLPTMATTAGEIVDAFVREMTPNTRLVFFSHVLSPTGLVLPAKEICAEARRLNILTVVDGAHAPAMLPLNLAEVDADFYCGNGHKWLLAPTGTGFLYIGVGNKDRLTPLQVSWGYHFDRSKPDERDEFGSTPRLRALEFEGTRDVCPWLTVPAAIDFQAALGWENVRARVAELAQFVRDKLTGHCGLELATPPEPGLHGAMTAFRIPSSVRSSWSEIRQRFWDRGIEVPVVERPDFNLLRVSTQFYNTREEVTHLRLAVSECLK